VEWFGGRGEEPGRCRKVWQPERRSQGRAAKASKAKSGKGTKKNKLTTGRAWVVPTFLTLLLLGVAWLVVWYLTTSTGITVPVMTGLGNWNMLIAMVLMGASFGVATLWK